jgi:lysophospholipase L1-like esterase
MSDPASTSPSRARAFAIATTALVLFAIAIGLVLTEVVLRIAGPRETHYFVLRPNLRVEFDPDPRLTPGIEGRARFSVNSLGLRGDELPPGDSVRRFLVVGGSTTENVYLDDTETWTHVLQSALVRAGGAPVWVGAAGKGGMNARDHVVQIAQLLESIPRPDRLVVLVGVNDLTVALAQGDTFRPPPPLSDAEARKAQERRAFAVVPGALHENLSAAAASAWYKRTALWQAGIRVRAGLGARSGRRDLQQDTRAQAVQRWREARARAPKRRDDLPSLDGALAEYRRNLETIASLAAAKGVPVSFLTQPSLWRADLDSTEARLLWFGGLGDFQSRQVDEYYSPAALAKAMAAFNTELLAVCAMHGLSCLDLAERIPRTTAYFFDDVHFTERGAAAVGEEVGAWMPPSAAPLPRGR